MNIRILILLATLIPQIVFSQIRQTKELSDGWRFQKGENKNAYQIDFNDAKWESVSVPHDWAIYGPFDKEIDKQVVAIVQNGEEIASEKTGRTGALPYIGQAWYRNEFSLTDFDENKKVILLFEGAMSEPKVYINGEKVGEWNYGYSYFYFDILSSFKQIEKTLSPSKYPTKDYHHGGIQVLASIEKCSLLSKTKRVLTNGVHL